MKSKLLGYILKRLLLALLTIWAVITITFFVMHAVPGGQFTSEKAISPEVQAALERKYGLDKSVPEQYVTYLKDIVTKFDFGPSLKMRGRNVLEIIEDGLKTSAKIGVIAAVIALVMGIVLGAVAALRRNKLIDRIIMILTTAFVSMPSFIMGSFLLLVFAVSLKILPANGSTTKGLILPILITHDLGVVAQMCDEVIVMYAGSICEQGTADEIFYRPAHEYTKGLMRSIPTEKTAGKKLQPIAGTPIDLLNMPKGCPFAPRCENAMKICLTQRAERYDLDGPHQAACWMNLKKAVNAGVTKLEPVENGAKEA